MPGPKHVDYKISSFFLYILNHEYRCRMQTSHIYFTLFAVVMLGFVIIRITNSIDCALYMFPTADMHCSCNGLGLGL